MCNQTVYKQDISEGVLETKTKGVNSCLEGVDRETLLMSKKSGAAHPPIVYIHAKHIHTN